MRIRQLLALAMLLPLLAYSGEVEVLHYWTSGGEAAALDVLKSKIEKEGHQWRDFTVAGGGGGNAMNQLQSRVLKGMPPAAAQIKGLDIQRWARLGFLRDLSELASAGHWNRALPPVVAQAMQQSGTYVAVPVNVHRTNWLWVNKPLLDWLGMKPPATWDEFDAIAEAAQAKGIQVIAHGDQAWQDATLFEVVALSVGGPQYYQKAYVDHLMSTLNSPTTAAVFARYYQLLQWAAPGKNGNEWNQATESVIKGDALFQFMGDWAKGEFNAAGMEPGLDYLCLPVPGTEGEFLFNIDSFAIFQLRQPSADDLAAQNALVTNIMSEDFQRTFNYAKGSIPARTDISPVGFDQCAQDSMRAFIEADRANALLPSIAHGMATTSSIQQQFYSEIQALTDEPETPEQSARSLAKSIRYAQYLLR